ncbi:hypothetical protein [Secundilactobacillus kimchicus]|uniref:HTH merR-type domain-containing protein n=1 Tax=Secundilactobacillus kimchicus JCM 15530 TaxID=1302272 RepID=A0A0R1HP63_9LACO|nr:hypothetical protein [Secundilactobacillus kimchicus]KRK48654.1 hypothetical protein FC96_GL000968 [Secundilactobacillus kimchicus JCM 15530]MBT9672125.1 hypothetical protein [Secundilactobacillus kimchicus]
MNDEKYLTAGQFAEMLHIDRHLLDTYDKRGLFQPEYRENNGHKWYSLGQINDWQLCFSLNQLSKASPASRPTDYQSALRQQQRLLEAQINQLVLAQERVSESLTRLETAAQVVLGRITEVDRTIAPLLVTPRPKTSDDLAALVVKHVNRYVLAGTMPSPIVVGQRVRRGEATVNAVYTPLTEGTSHEADVTLPAGRYLLSYRAGDQPAETAFQSMHDYAHDHRLILGDSFYQTPVQTTVGESPLAPKIVKILIKVRS